MAEIIVIGGGVVGLGTGMLLARDGHRVTVLERDPAPPPAGPHDAWAAWERRSVGQFRQLHYVQPRFRATIERELPDALAALQAEGACRVNLIEGIPPQVTGGVRADDERFTTWTARRPVIERAFAVAAAAVDGLEVRRGVVVRGLLTEERTGLGVPHVTGVVTDDGPCPADLVVDASGRRSALPSLLAAIGAAPMQEETEDSGFAYYTRHFRSADGSVPPMFGPLLQPYGSISLLTLPADNGTWGVGIIASAKDRALRAATDPDVWTAIVRSFPLVAHWTDGEPITGVDPMANIPDRIRSVVVDGEPVVTGIVPVADAWACTNPSVGRGITLGMVHAVELRDALREDGTTDARALTLRFAERTAASVEPWYRDTVAFDHHRLGEIDAAIAGTTYATDDPSHALSHALRTSAPKDPELLRGYLEVATVHARGIDVLSRPGVAARAIELAGDDHLPGPDRGALEAIVAGVAR